MRTLGEMTSPGLGYNHCTEMCNWPSYYYIFVKCFTVDGGKNEMCKKIKTAEQIVKITAGTGLYNLYRYNQLLLVTPNSHVDSIEI